MVLGSAHGHVGRSARRRKVAGAGVLVLLALVATACGSRLPDDVLAEIDAQRAGFDGAGGTAAQAAGDISGTADTVPGAGGSSGTVAGGGTAASGATDGGGGSGGAGAAQAASCSGGGGGAPGVTATEIKVATMVTASGPLPGATEGSYRGAQAYFAKINAEGGICGRKITVVKGDDGLDPQRARGEFLRLEPNVFAFVGSLAVADSGYVDLVASTKVPYIGTFVDPAGRAASNVFPRLLSGVAQTGPFVYYRQQYPDVKNVAFLFADIGGVRENTPASREGIKRVGYNIVYDSGAQSTAPDFTAEVINMQRAGTQMVYLFAFEVNMHVRLARNMRQQNFEPPLKVGQIAYNSKLIELLGDISNGWSNHIDYLPMLNPDEPARSPALQEFITWNQRVFPGAQIDLFPVNAWSSSALFAEALRAVGADVTRERLLAALEAIKSTDGGGIRGPSNPSTGETDGCFIIVKVVNRTWVREHPAEGYDCDLGEGYKYG
jgi:ABC-type branched-subunit amino acid transport system substrate-binding protein